MAERARAREALFAHVEAHEASYIARLAEAVAIPSVSAQPKHREDCVAMVELYRAELEKLGVATELRDLGLQALTGLALPPVILGRCGNDPSKRTVCAYGHLDVQPAAKADGWATEPFVLTRVDATAEEDAARGYGAFPSGGSLYGRGSSDDKGPALCWLFLLEAYQKLGLELPVNLLFLVECMEESGSEGLEAVVVREFAPGGFLEAAEAICCADNYWLGTRKPCVQYGLRGIVYFFAECCGPEKDLHSGKWGGAVHEPMIDLVHVLGSLVDARGAILVPGLMEAVAPLLPAEEALYDEVDFDLDGLERVSGAPALLHPESTKAQLLHMWRYPSLSIHGIEGAHASPGAKTVIPSKVVGKFSIRIVADMEPAAVERLVSEHCAKVHGALGSPNTLRVFSEHGAPAFSGDPADANYAAARRANKAVYGVEPDLVRSGGSIPVTLTMQATGRSVVLFPIGRGDDGAHSQNEKLDVNQLLAGVKLLGAYLDEYAAGAQAGAPTKPASSARRPEWATRKWGMCGNLAEGQCACCF